MQLKKVIFSNLHAIIKRAAGERMSTSFDRFSLRHLVTTDAGKLQTSVASTLRRLDSLN